ncbi:MAG: NAD(P)H-dependent oxidoreductase [Hyphomonas sp.]|uniref:NAD(P)H-dependent oxidoreductase n=1 Tax=Hyphomonas sp. TaxID=87 RepID=UPI003528B683
MAARIFLFVGHPRTTSLSHGMADAYQRGAERAGAEIRRMHLSDMAFDPDLTEGYHSRKTLEPCLEEWRENTLWAGHLVWAYPQWWGGMPAKMKGVIDRSFLPGFAMRYHDKGPWWDRLLAGRSADILMTSDAPPLWDALTYHRAAKNQVERTVLNFAGVKPVRTLQFGTIKGAPEARISKWLKQVEARGETMAQKRA